MDFNHMVDQLRNILSKKRKEKNTQQEDWIKEKQVLQDNIRKLEMRSNKEQENHLEQMRQLKIHLDSLEEENKQL